MHPTLALGVLAVLGVLLGVPSASASPPRPKYVECVDNKECGTWECCLLGSGRFSLPRCSPMSDVGDFCRRDARGADRPTNMTVLYPDGQEVLLSAVHLMACPCSAGLACADGLCTASAEFDLNAL